MGRNIPPMQPLQSSIDLRRIEKEWKEKYSLKKEKPSIIRLQINSLLISVFVLFLFLWLIGR